MLKDVNYYSFGPPSYGHQFDHYNQPFGYHQQAMSDGRLDRILEELSQLRNMLSEIKQACFEQTYRNTSNYNSYYSPS